MPMQESDDRQGTSKGQPTKTTKTDSKIFDNVFHTLLKKAGKTLFEVLNEAFGESYTGKEQVIYKDNEHFVWTKDKEIKKVISDASFTIAYGQKVKKYLFECQTWPDNTMLVRLTEYAMDIALEDGRITEQGFETRMPHIAILYLHRDASMKKKKYVVLHYGDKQLKVPVKVMQLQDYTLKEILQKQLYFLAPFVFFLYENRLDQFDENEAERTKFVEEMKAFFQQIEMARVQGELDQYTYDTIIDSSGFVYRKLTEKYEVLRNEVEAFMGGHVIELPFEREKRLREEEVKQMQEQLNEQRGAD